MAENWVDEQGGLPSYIKRIEKHLEARGMGESEAIATAVNAAKKMCATGDLNFPGDQDVNPGSRAEACAAIAQWEAMKARARADNSTTSTTSTTFVMTPAMSTTFATAPAVPKVTSTRRWEGPVLPMDSDSDDGRQFRSDVTIAELPLPLSYQRVRQDKHDGAVTVGIIDRVDNRGGVLWAYGELFDPDEFSGRDADDIRAATNLIRLGLGLVSADTLARSEMAAGKIVASEGLFKGATLVGLPAFQEARVRLAAESFGLQLPDASAHDALVEPARLVDCPDGLCDVVFAATGAADLPIGPDEAWDGPAAAQRMLDAATTDGKINVGKAGRGFFWRTGDGTKRGDYHLPFADVVDGELVVIPRALSAVLSRLGQVADLPASDEAAIRTKVARYQARARSDQAAAAIKGKWAFAVTGDTELPTVERGSAADRAWDNGAAFEAVFVWAGKGTPEGPDVSKLAKAFLYRNPDRDPQTKWAWKIPIATVVGGELRIVPQAVFNASTIVSGGRSPVDIPAPELAKVRAKIQRLYKRINYVPPADRKNPRIVEKVTAAVSVQTYNGPPEGEPFEVEVDCPVCIAGMDEMMTQAMAEVVANLDQEVGGNDG